jgi:hypothetical protein
MVISREFFPLEKSKVPKPVWPDNRNAPKQRPETMLYQTVLPPVGNKTASLAFEHDVSLYANSYGPKAFTPKTNTFSQPNLAIQCQ